MESKRIKHKPIPEDVLLEFRQKAMTFWIRVTKLWKASGVNQRTLARETGIGFQTLHHGIARGEVYPTEEMLDSLAAFFEVDPRSLLPWGVPPTQEGRSSWLAWDLMQHLESLPRRLRWSQVHPELVASDRGARRSRQPRREFQGQRGVRTGQFARP